MQEVTWGIMQTTNTVRLVGDTADVSVGYKNADYTPAIGDRVLLAKAGSTDSWVIVCELGATS